MSHGISCRSLGILALLLLTTLPAAADATHAGPHVTRVHLTKSTHALTLFDGDQVVASFHASIGPGGPGFKRREGDNVTPVGRYHVQSHQASQYRIFLRLDYPNADDRARFAALKASGELPPSARIGSDIGIHGTPQSHEWDGERDRFRDVDWTAGCVAVQDEEIDRIAALVSDGTVIEIED
jgi:murein L,D-transpeptidase YafK